MKPDPFSAAELVRPAPLAKEAPLPSRKQIRAWLAPVSAQRTGLAIALLVLDWVIFAALISAIVLVTPWWAKALLGCAAGFVIGRLFIIGHDACHQSYTPNRTLNRWLGRIAFLASLTPYSLWEVGHNVVHHGYTNLKGKDFVWQPFSLEEFRALPKWRQTLERFYRSGWGPGLYYFIEMWWLKMFFPSRKQMPSRRPIFLADSLLSLAAGVVWVGALVWAAQATGQSAWALVGWAFVLPFVFWNFMIGFVVYAHHTHTAVIWHEDKTAWAAADPFVSTTVHLQFPMGIGSLVHNIMEHTAHHVDMSVPLYSLKKAQSILEEALPGRIVIQNFSWSWYFDTARRCKLYDIAAQQWTDFEGRPTGQTTHGRVA
ncbi:fatty acid desaturase [Roseateles sp. BYS180W]|uniref:Fatty acid desaturase n=1 Tax=Roseateles rivi TaxID=3299028 RepID=A0ABW7FUS4_9BURK